jgi:hypothetical protein
MSANRRPKKHAAILTEDRDKKQDTAFRIRLGKDAAGMQYLEVRCGERKAIIAATDLLLARRELAAKLITQGVLVSGHRKLSAPSRPRHRSRPQGHSPYAWAASSFPGA